MGFDRQIANDMAQAMRTRVIDDVLAYSGKGTHPRIFLTASEFERVRTSEDEVFVRGRRYVISRATMYLDKPLLVYNIPDGIRLLQVSRDMLDRSLYLGMAYRLTGDDRFAERLWRELENVAVFKDWNPYHHLDVGEMCNAFGIAYDWIYEYLSEEQKRVITDALVKKGFEATMDDYLDRERRRSYRWYQDDPGDNWVFVCNGGATVAALAICDEEWMDREYLEGIFGYAFSRTYRAVREMYLPDGSYAEGFTYWNYASDYLGYYITALRSAAGSEYGLCDYEPVHRSAYYVKMMCANTFRSFNFGDAIETFMCPEVMMWLGKFFADPRITTMRRREVMSEKNTISTVRDIMWYEPCEEVSLEGMALGFGSVGGDNAAVRAGFAEDDLYAAICFGDNDAYHAHADMGNFVVEWRGRRFFCDLGQDNYNVKNYRNAYRYRAEGHNTLVINPGDGEDQERFCIVRIDRFSDGTECDACAVADMSVAYPGRTVKRGLKITADLGAVVVQDELGLVAGDEGYWFAHTAGEVKIAEDGRSAVVEIKGESMLVSLLAGGRGFEVMPCIQMNAAHVQEHQRDNSAFTRLAVRFGAEDTVLAVQFTPIVDGKPVTGASEIKPLAEW